MPSQAKAEVSFEEEALAILRVEASDGASLLSVSEFLGAINKIHRRIQALDTIFILAAQGSRFPLSRFQGQRLKELVAIAEVRLVLPKLHAAEFHSPGFWEILGSLSPLKFISDCLIEWREHQKDAKYRNEADAAKLFLENQLRTNEVLKQRIDLLRSIGVSDSDLQRAFVKPLASQTTTLLKASQSSSIAANSMVNYIRTNTDE